MPGAKEGAGAGQQTGQAQALTDRGRFMTQDPVL
jgi:hypothetical protein